MMRRIGFWHALADLVTSSTPTISPPSVVQDGQARPRALLQGDPPSPVTPPSGCRFRTRCPYATDRCAAEVPALREVEPGHFVACHYAGEVGTGSAQRPG